MLTTFEITRSLASGTLSHKLNASIIWGRIPFPLIELICVYGSSNALEKEIRTTLLDKEVNSLAHCFPTIQKFQRGFEGYRGGFGHSLLTIELAQLVVWVELEMYGQYLIESHLRGATYKENVQNLIAVRVCVRLRLRTAAPPSHLNRAT